MRRISILIIVSLFVLSFSTTPLLADEHANHSCGKAEKSCCTKNEDCCKTKDAECCKAEKACCNDTACCKKAEDGTHTCAMKHADGTACASTSCCKEKSCDMKKTS